MWLKLGEYKKFSDDCDEVGCYIERRFVLTPVASYIEIVLVRRELIVHDALEPILERVACELQSQGMRGSPPSGSRSWAQNIASKKFTALGKQELAPKHHH